MKELLDKLSSYNIFNFLLPGVLFAYLVTTFTTYQLIQNDMVVGVFLYYFLGLICSRIGSLIIEPFLKKVGFVKFAQYSKYVAACKEDQKIELLSEVNNMYRTFCAMFFVLGVVKLYDYLSFDYPILVTLVSYVSIVVLMALFLYSYKKQTAFIKNRIEITQK